jgi:hypothetical protein
MGRRISDISEDLYNLLIDWLKTSCFVLQVDEAIDLVSDTHLIPY